MLLRVYVRTATQEACARSVLSSLQIYTYAADPQPHCSMLNMQDVSLSTTYFSPEYVIPYETPTIKTLCISFQRLNMVDVLVHREIF